MPSKRDIVVKRWVFREPVRVPPRGRPIATDAVPTVTIETQERVVVLTAGGDLRCSCQALEIRRTGCECQHLLRVRRLLDVQDRFRAIEVEAGVSTPPGPRVVPVAPAPKRAPSSDQNPRRKFRFKR